VSWGPEGDEPRRDEDRPDAGSGEPPPTPPDRSGSGTGWGDDQPGQRWNTGGDRLRPLNLGDVLDGTFRIAGRHWQAFALALSVAVVPLSLLSGLVFAQTMGTTPGLIETLQDPDVAQTVAEPTATELARLAGAGALSAIAGILLTPLIYGIATVVAARGYRTGAVDVGDAVRTAARRWPALLGATILAALLPALVFALPGVVVAVGLAADASAVVAIGVAGFLVSLAFAVITVIRLVLVAPAVVLEQAGPIQSLRRSNELVRGRTGMVLGTMLVVYIIVAIIGSILTLPFQVFGTALGDAVGAVAATAGQIVSSLVTNSLLGVAVVLIYFDRRVRGEGYDLSEMAGRLQDRPDPGW
jgi:hypothetical protein